MEMTLKREALEAEQPVGQRSVQAQVSAETAAPGAGREAIEILLEDAAIAVEAAEAQTDRVVVDATVTCQAVYRQGEGSAVRAVTAQARCGDAIELPGVTAKSIVRAAGAVEDVQATYENGRISFTVSIALRVQADELRSIELVGDIADVDGIEARREEQALVKLAAESSAEALLTEEVALPAQLDARVALMDFASVHIDGLTPDLGGVRVRGSVQAESLIGTGSPARPVALVKVPLPFDQLVELPEALTGETSAEAEVTRLRGEIVPSGEEGDASIKLEADLRVKVNADARETRGILADAYGAGDTAVEAEQTEIPVCTGSASIDCQEAFRGTLLLLDGAPGVGTVLAVRAVPVIEGWRAENGQTVVEGALGVKALYLTGGSERVEAARGELPFELRCAGEWPEHAWVRAHASGTEAAALMSDRIEIKCALCLSGFYRTRGAVTAVTDAKAAEAPARGGGLVIVWPGEGDDAWSVAKRCRVPRDAVKMGETVVVRVR